MRGAIRLKAAEPAERADQVGTSGDVSLFGRGLQHCGEIFVGSKQAEPLDDASSQSLGATPCSLEQGIAGVLAAELAQDSRRIGP